LAELNAAYQAFSDGRPIEAAPIRPYGDFIGWIQEQDPAVTKAYWERRLAGFRAPTALPIDRSPGAPQGRNRPAWERLRLSEATSAALQSLTRQRRLTM